MIGFGDTASVGIGGLTTGGGVGYLVRRDGLTIDNLIGAEVVTADGQIHTIDANEDLDLFWAIRGGGGNFGVATKFRYRLNELPAFYGGMLVLPATPRRSPASSPPRRRHRRAVDDRECHAAPPMPFLPEEAVGKVVILGMIAFAGDAEAGERAVAPFRALAEPMADLVQEGPYTVMFPPEEGGEEYHPLAVSVNMHVDHVDREVATTILDFLEKSDATLRAAQVRVLGGAMARVPSDATAYAHRSNRIMVNLAAFYEGEEDRPAKEAWVRRVPGGHRPGDRAVYNNFLGGQGPGARPRRLSERDVGSPRRDQAPIRSGQPVPAEPERHPVGAASGMKWRRQRAW